MSIYDGTTRTQLRKTAREARAEIQATLRLLDAGQYETAVEVATEAAGLVGNFEGEVEAYAARKTREQLHANHNHTGGSE